MCLPVSRPLLVLLPLLPTICYCSIDRSSISHSRAHPTRPSGFCFFDHSLVSSLFLSGAGVAFLLQLLLLLFWPGMALFWSTRLASSTTTIPRTLSERCTDFCVGLHRHRWLSATGHVFVQKIHGPHGHVSCVCIQTGRQAIHLHMNRGTRRHSWNQWQLVYTAHSQ